MTQYPNRPKKPFPSNPAGTYEELPTMSFNRAEKLYLRILYVDNRITLHFNDTLLYAIDSGNGPFNDRVPLWPHIPTGPDSVVSVAGYNLTGNTSNPWHIAWRLEIGTEANPEIILKRDLNGVAFDEDYPCTITIINLKLI